MILQDLQVQFSENLHVLEPNSFKTNSWKCDFSGGVCSTSALFGRCLEISIPFHIPSNKTNDSNPRGSNWPYFLADFPNEQGWDYQRHPQIQSDIPLKIKCIFTSPFCFTGHYDTVPSSSMLADWQHCGMNSALEQAAQHYGFKFSMKWPLEPEFHDFHMPENTVKVNSNERKQNI